MQMKGFYICGFLLALLVAIGFDSNATNDEALAKVLIEHEEAIRLIKLDVSMINFTISTLETKDTLQQVEINTLFGDYND